MNYRLIKATRSQMERASAGLPAVYSPADGLPVYFLTGKNYLYQTLFCIRSLVISTKTQFRFVLVDDGSFDRKLIGRMNKQLPGADIITSDIIKQNLERIIPVLRYPYLHHKRVVYPHIRKLTDIHTLEGPPWKLVLDSDMLFWTDPVALTGWLKHTDHPLHMVDCGEAYGYSPGLMNELCGEKIRPLINVGAIGLNSSSVDWGHLEHWIKVLEEKEGTSYYLEQALSAMIIGEKHSQALDARQYIVNPDTTAIDAQQGVLHHYVDLSKEGYFKQAWRKIVD